MVNLGDDPRKQEWGSRGMRQERRSDLLGALLGGRAVLLRSPEQLTECLLELSSWKTVVPAPYQLRVSPQALPSLHFWAVFLMPRQVSSKVWCRMLNAVSHLRWDTCSMRWDSGHTTVYCSHSWHQKWAENIWQGHQKCYFYGYRLSWLWNIYM